MEYAITTDTEKLNNVFRQLKGLKDNKDFSKTIENWNKARRYVLTVLPQRERHSPLNGIGFSPSSGKHLHVIIIGISELMLCIARQIALIAHYPNFYEEGGGNRTVITIVYNSSDLQENKSIIDHISKEEYLCNLTLLCKYTIKKWDGEKETEIKKENEYSFIDIELELVATNVNEGCEYMKWKKYTSKDYDENASTIIVSEDDVKNDDLMNPDNPDYYKTMPIDIRNARRANMVYYIGADIDNLPPDDPNTVERYSRALHYFCYQQSKEDTFDKWNSFFKKDGNGEYTTTVKDQIELRNLLSNVFCADCFESRLRSVVTIDAIKAEFAKSIFFRSKYLFSWQGHRFKSKFDDFKNIKEINKDMFDWLLQYEYCKVLRIVKANLTVLAKCEHARWNVEKLILGFSPLSDKERMADEQKFGEARKQYRKKLKKDSKCPKHIDLCSYHDLQRLNPADMKFDCFLMLAMAWILKKGVNQ